MTDELGLRDRKKAATRRALAEVALRLFAERGFDSVTVADVAAEAGVSTKTAFNYFATKEDLVLGDGESLDADALRAIAERAAGTSVLDAVRAHTLETSRRMRETPAATRQAFRKVLQAAPTVQARWREGSRRFEERVAALLAEDADVGDPAPFVVAGIVGLMRRLAFYDVIGWPDGKRRSSEVSEEAIERAFDLVAGGLSRYGVRKKPSR